MWYTVCFFRLMKCLLTVVMCMCFMFFVCFYCLSCPGLCCQMCLFHVVLSCGVLDSCDCCLICDSCSWRCSYMGEFIIINNK